MAKPKQIPSAVGYWPLLAPEMQAFCSAWMGNPITSRQLHRFVKDWKKVATWGGSNVPSQDSQHSLISAVVRTHNPVDTSQILIINERTLIRPAQHGLVNHHIESRRDKQVVGSVLYSQTGCYTGPIRQMETTSELILRVDDLTVIQQAFPDFTSAWLAYARQLVTNRSDKELVIRVWLHTHHRTQDPDHPGKLRQWIDDDFTYKDIARCIQRDTAVEVSERTVRAVVSKLRLADLDSLPMPRVPSRGATTN